MEEKNPKNLIGDAPVSDTRAPEVEKRKRDYDQVAEEVAPTREYSFLFYNSCKTLTPNLDANVDMSVVRSLPFSPLTQV